MIEAKRVEEMKRLSAETTIGPWRHAGLYGVVSSEEISMPLRPNDAQFIAESRQFVPDIIAAYEQQAAEIDRLQAEAKAMFHAGYAAAKKDQRKLNEKLAEEALRNE